VIDAKTSCGDIRTLFKAAGLSVKAFNNSAMRLDATKSAKDGAGDPTHNMLAEMNKRNREYWHKK
jgi:hypothetical protein